jgi:alpha-galactosidase/6-phospho-beta-glucosidase family protein
VQTEYNTYKEQVESEKAEATKEALAKKRVSEILEAGVELSEASRNKLFVRFREMDEESYVEFRDLLIETASVSTKEQEQEEKEVEEVTTASVIPNLEETTASRDRKNIFEKMWSISLNGGEK